LGLKNPAISPEGLRPDHFRHQSPSALKGTLKLSAFVAMLAAAWVLLAFLFWAVHASVVSAKGRL
jgi:hypothetical protein